ncbi:unnamed protein product (macronuclear) [Paramecium tetraurelia]|uniref:Uncharacterized protein n=1 Tax=Paramecium tetraurelia TaxID=5888 RepID=A0CQR6_PARTE|nr:uncharacterized protein GSPATT00009481001 [Paramecium tetraurelia]CAK73133.1 unnamed protein product [Paramecium tetraurelia]|eukprot:XP_001440530.1 hypothetical protein (macronuclear) [Paramecium tetraurelia strain d4-2]
MSNAAEKISDLFNVSLNELETNIVASAVKFNSQPQRLLDELQQSVMDFKSKFYDSLHNLLQFIAQFNNGKDILKIAQQVETNITKFKQQQLLVQMKVVLNSKLKALLETFCGENQQKFEVQNQIKHLKESLLKIETTLMEQQQLTSTPQQNFITPYPKKNFITASSQDILTPNLSDEAEMRGKGFFITPENRQQQPRQFDHSQQQYSSNESNSVQQNKTLNSFDKEKSEDKTDLQSPFFGLQQDHPKQPKLFQNEIMNDYLQRVPLEEGPQESQLLDESNQYFHQDQIIKTTQQQHQQQPLQQQQSNKIQQKQQAQPQIQTQWQNLQLQQTFQHIDSLQTTRTEQFETQPRVSTPKENQIQTRNQSVEPNIREISQSPNGKRLIQTSKSKEPFSRCRSSLETTNLLQKLNSAEASKPTNKLNKSKSNKENQAQPMVKCSKPSKPQITVQKQKNQVVTRPQSSINIVKKQKSN